jgi:hypothetical protein
LCSYGYVAACIWIRSCAPFVVDVSVARTMSSQQTRQLPEDGLIRPKHVGVLIILISECFKKCILGAKSCFLKYKIRTLARLHNKKMQEKFVCGIRLLKRQEEERTQIH